MATEKILKKARNGTMSKLEAPSLMSISGASLNTSAVTNAYLSQLNQQAPAKPAHNQPTEPTPQEDKVQLSAAAKKASGDVDHDGDSR